MQASHDYEKDCVRYLLGEMSEPAQTKFEEAYFADDSLFERFLVVKDELVDSYARGDLDGPRRERFEKHFLSSEPRRQRVAEAETLIRAATAASAKERPTLAVREPWWRSISRGMGLPPLAFQAGLAVLLLVVLAGSWLMIRNVRRQSAESERQQDQELARRRKEAEQAPAKPSPANQDLTAKATATPALTNRPDSNNQPPALQNRDRENRDRDRPIGAAPSSGLNVGGQRGPAVASVVLLPFASRDASNSTALVLGPRTHTVELHLTFKKTAHRRYDASLRSVDGTQVLSRRGLKMSAGTEARVTVTFPASLIQGQDYIVTLTGLTDTSEAETIGEYYFRVERKAR